MFLNVEHIGGKHLFLNVEYIGGKHVFLNDEYKEMFRWETRVLKYGCVEGGRIGLGGGDGVVGGRESVCV